ncbi:hypothetical protein WJX84_009342 [Apatococcus fuscideae]|uniref:BCNT-C domain-containing protein n=1 Tax=Apatococcus fuscideae TaxID=2026836 RepID=A0AAW1SYZ9_9CHLO
MASLLTADLPSEDEEDQDFVPQAEAAPKLAGKRVAALGQPFAAPQQSAAKRAKIEAAWELLNKPATKRANVLDKSRGDWTAFKRSDKSADEELLAHTNSNKKYLDKVDFLKRAEINEYEQETAARLQGDIRLRGQS